MQQKRLLLTSLFSALIIVGAFLRFPLPPVPITLQTLFVLLAGFLGGPSIALGSTAIYLLLGAIGLPIFSSGGGLGLFLGPTGGFLFGMLPMAFLSGLASTYPNKGEHPRKYTLLCVLFGLGATVVLYLVGIPFLKYVANLSWKVALQVGMVPFILGDLLKIIIAAHLARMFHGRIEQFLG
ncbi:MAG: biotin transporter BioY [Sphaerochaetaceae bacterium]